MLSESHKKGSKMRETAILDINLLFVKL
jgi:hypothetical protein